MKTDNVTKLLLGLIALGLFANATSKLISPAYAEVTKSSIKIAVHDCMHRAEIHGHVDSHNMINAKIVTKC